MNKKLLTIASLLLVLLLFSDCSRRQRGNSATAAGSSRSERSEHRRASGSKTVIKMRKESGVYHIPCKINGTEMEFIFDTGAADITMSLTEAKFLYKQGRLQNEDFIGSEQYQIADGSIHEGMVVNLRTVEIGSWLLKDVKASIVNSEGAPLLLGQSALAAFGKISIDYTKNEITFE
ncbi:MAG: retroviral-like aspartic protease family protein [Prevotella sp.]|jgi:aspartyl protease family protein|nr:retroviral-like aspartic protease family protein [Prevotella sp.]